MLIVTPWTPVWLRNYFAHAWPWLGQWMANVYVQSAVTGVGVVTTLVGLRDLLVALASRRAAASAPSITSDGPRP